MNRDYRFESVYCGGKSISFTVHNALDFRNAKQKAVAHILKTLKQGNSDFKKQYRYLTQNIEKGETRVSPLKNEEQLGLDFESKFNQTYEMLYNGIINEDV